MWWLETCALTVRMCSHFVPCVFGASVLRHTQPQAPPPVVHSARTVRNDVNVKRDSITFTPASPGSKTCFLSFKFDAARPCTATVYFCATETTNGDNVTTKCVLQHACNVYCDH